MATDAKAQAAAATAKAASKQHRDEVANQIDPRFYALLQTVRKEHPDVYIHYELKVDALPAASVKQTGVVNHNTRPQG